MLSDVYEYLGCTKADISRWSSNPFTTQAVIKKHKLNVVRSAAVLFDLSEDLAESLANKAGLSLRIHENVLAELLENCGSAKRRLIYHSAVSERMIQYYISGKDPTKQALLAIAICLGMREAEIKDLLGKYGYCLSASLANDVVVRWYLCNGIGAAQSLLAGINETLDDLGLPLLMTKAINRNI